MKRRAAPQRAVQGGQTLIELLAVLSILAIVLRLAYPTTAPATSFVMEAGIREVVQALRFAQSDAVRSGSYRMVSFDPVSERLRVYGLDMNALPNEDSNLVLHPLDKKPYDMVLPLLPAAQGLAIKSATFNYSDNTTMVQLGFKWDGTPVKVVGPRTTDVKTLSGPGVVVLNYGAVERTVSIDPDTGRVSVLP